MHAALLNTHSILRYFVMILLLIVILKSLFALVSKSPYSKGDNLLSLSLFSVTHTQLLVGLILYFVSPFVQFSGATMKDPIARYWTVEHSVMMLLAIVLITLGRIRAKKATGDASKHKTLLIFNSIALIIIVVAISMSKRGLY